MKKLSLNEEFTLEGNVYVFSQKDASISLKRLRESKSKPSFIPPTLEMVKEYFKVNGYTQAAAIKAHGYYDIADWRDSKGSPVLNWKQKLLANWMKPDNLIKHTADEKQGIKFFQ